MNLSSSDCFAFPGTPLKVECLADQWAIVPPNPTLHPTRPQHMWAFFLQIGRPPLELALDLDPHCCPCWPGILLVSSTLSPSSFIIVITVIMAIMDLVLDAHCCPCWPGILLVSSNNIWDITAILLGYYWSAQTKFICPALMNLRKYKEILTWDVTGHLKQDKEMAAHRGRIFLHKIKKKLCTRKGLPCAKKYSFPYFLREPIFSASYLTINKSLCLTLCILTTVSLN